MSNLSSNESFNELLDDISMHFNRYASMVIFIFGVLGNILNILVLSQRSFRSNSCAWIFLASSFVNLISILSGLITIMIGGWTTNPSNTIGWVCKLRAYFVFSTRTIAPWLVTLATIDRWLLSSVDASRRQKSTLKNAQRWTTVIIIVSVLLYAQQLYCYEANLIDTPLKCYGKTAACRLATDVSFAAITIIMPLFLMILFGLLTIANVRQSQRRIQSLTARNPKSTANKASGSNNGNSEGRFKQRTDRSLLRMLLFQVILLTVFTLPLSLDKFYSSFSGENSSSSKMALNSFIYDLAILIYFVSNGMPFYVYTLCGGAVFRKALHDFIIMMKGKLMCR